MALVAIEFFKLFEWTSDRYMERHPSTHPSILEVTPQLARAEPLPPGWNQETVASFKSPMGGRGEEWAGFRILKMIPPPLKTVIEYNRNKIFLVRLIECAFSGEFYFSVHILLSNFHLVINCIAQEKYELTTNSQAVVWIFFAFARYRKHLIFSLLFSTCYVF